MNCTLIVAEKQRKGYDVFQDNNIVAAYLNV